MDSNLDELASQLESIERSEGKVEVEDESADEMLDKWADMTIRDLTESDVRELLPKRAELRRNGELWAEVVSQHEAQNAKLTDRRREILEYISEHPLQTDAAVARGVDTSETYVTSTKKDFRFLLKNDLLYGYFIDNSVPADDTEESVETEEVPTEETAQERYERQREEVNAEDNATADDTAKSVEDDDSEVTLDADEGFEVISGLIKSGLEGKARAIFDKFRS